MVGRKHFREIKKDYTLKKKNGSLRLNIVPYKEKNFFLEQLIYFGSQSLMSFYFTKISVHL